MVFRIHFKIKFKTFLIWTLTSWLMHFYSNVNYSLKCLAITHLTFFYLSLATSVTPFKYDVLIVFHYSSILLFQVLLHLLFCQISISPQKDNQIITWNLSLLSLWVPKCSFTEDEIHYGSFKSNFMPWVGIFPNPLSAGALLVVYDQVYFKESDVLKSVKVMKKEDHHRLKETKENDRLMTI